MSLEETIASTVRAAIAEAFEQRASETCGVFNLHQAAVFLGTSDLTVKQLIAAGDLPSLRVGREYRIGRRACDELLARGAQVGEAS